MVVTLLLFDRRMLLFPRRALILFVALGGSVALSGSTFLQSIARLEVGVAISLAYLYPVIVTLLARLVFKEPLFIRKGVALLLSVFGCSLVSGLWESAISISALGIFFALAAGTGLAAYTLLVKVAVRDHPPGRVLTYSLAFSLPFLFLTNVLSQEAIFKPYPLCAWGIVLLVTLFPILFGHYLFALALGRIESSRASIIATIEPVLASLLAFAVLGERLSPLQILGMALILIAAVLAQWKEAEPTYSGR